MRSIPRPSACLMIETVTISVEEDLQSAVVEVDHCDKILDVLKLPDHPADGMYVVIDSFGEAVLILYIIQG